MERKMKTRLQPVEEREERERGREKRETVRLTKIDDDGRQITQATMRFNFSLSYLKTDRTVDLGLVCPCLKSE